MAGDCSKVGSARRLLETTRRLTNALVSGDPSSWRRLSESLVEATESVVAPSRRGPEVRPPPDGPEAPNGAAGKEPEGIAHSGLRPKLDLERALEEARARG